MKRTSRPGFGALPLSTVKKGIRAAIEADPKRRTHGQTKYTQFFVYGDGKFGREAPYPYTSMAAPRQASRGNTNEWDRRGSPPDAILVHSHSAENWRHWEETTGMKELFFTFSLGDIKFLRTMIRYRGGNGMALIMADGRMEMLEVPDKPWVEVKLSALSDEEAERQIEGTPFERKILYAQGISEEAVDRRFMRRFAREYGLIYKEGLKWGAPKQQEMMFFKRKPPEIVPWVETIYPHPPSSKTSARTGYDTEFYTVVPPELWPVVPTQPELQYEKKGQKYTMHKERPELVQERFFGAADDPLEQVRQYYITEVLPYDSFIEPHMGEHQRTVIGMRAYDALDLTLDNYPVEVYKQLAARVEALKDELEQLYASAYRKHWGDYYRTEEGKKQAKYAAKKEEIRRKLSASRRLRPEIHQPLYQPELFGARGNQFAGRIMNCAAWAEDRYTGQYCVAYAPACKGQKKCAGGPIPQKGRKRPAKPLRRGQLKVCDGYKKVYSAYYAKAVDRCAHYIAACAPGACLPETMPRPEPEYKAPTEREIRDVAYWMANEQNVGQRQSGPWLAREISSRGGIAPYQRGVEKEEYKEIPLHLRNRRGLALDEMASEMGMQEVELRKAIEKAYPKSRKIKRQKNWKDFTAAAEAYLLQERSADL